MRLTLLIPALLVSAPAVAAVQPCILDEMVAEAPTVVQVTGQSVTGPDAVGLCVITGTVARSWLGALATGAQIKATFPCASPSLAPGPATYHDADEVARAGAVELHLDAEGGVAGYGWGLVTLEGVTEPTAFAREAEEC